MKEGSWYLAGLSGRGKVEAKVLMGSGMCVGVWGVCVCARACVGLGVRTCTGPNGRVDTGRLGLTGHIKMLFGFMACLLVFLLYSQRKGKPLRM